MNKAFFMKLAIIFIAIFCFANCGKDKPTNITTKGCIEGVITDSISGVTLSGTTITTSPFTISITTDTLGKYRLPEVNTGTYNVIANKMYYNSNSKIVTVIANDTVTLNLSLVPATGNADIEWINIPADSFAMGSDSIDLYFFGAEWPRHTVYLATYQISKYPITNGQYKFFIDAEGYNIQSYWSISGWYWRITNDITEPKYWLSGQYNSGPLYPNYPVVGVSWFEAEAFCRWVGGGMPTEAQWEKAARGTDHRFYPWGNYWDATSCNSSDNIGTDTFSLSSPVSFFPSGASPYDVFDMVGNVQEWVYDWYKTDYYLISPDANPIGPDTGIGRVLRGACYKNSYAYCRCAFRNDSYPLFRSEFIGFRVAR